MGEPASKWFVVDAEGTADLMSGLRADLADLDMVVTRIRNDQKMAKQKI